jgi:prophage tail gpP-like protein
MVGAEVNVYVGGQLAFTGTIDQRSGTGAKKGKHGTAKSTKETHGESMSLTVGPNEYSIKLSARGKTKRLIDSSHQHPTTNMMQPTTKDVVNKLVEPWETEIEWKGEEIKLDKVRFRDGARVVDELHRVALENCYFMYETRDGKLRVTDGVGTETSGDPLILGENILSFTAEQSEDNSKKKIKVKGQRTNKKYWGKNAIEKTFKEIEDKNQKAQKRREARLTVHHYGDADEKSLERRARFEMNKRTTASKKVTIEVFHVQSPSGQPWDIGDTHYVEIPPEGIFDMFEVTELSYHVNAEKELKTSLTLSPPPSGGAGGGFGLSSLQMNMGDARSSQAGFTEADGMFPAPWSPADLGELPLMSLVEELAQPQDEEEPDRPPPLILPPWFGVT